MVREASITRRNGLRALLAGSVGSLGRTRLEISGCFGEPCSLLPLHPASGPISGDGSARNPRLFARAGRRSQVCAQTRLREGNSFRRYLHHQPVPRWTAGRPAEAVSPLDGPPWTPLSRLRREDRERRACIPTRIDLRAPRALPGCRIPTGRYDAGSGECPVGRCCRAAAVSGRRTLGPEEPARRSARLDRNYQPLRARFGKLSRSRVGASVGFETGVEYDERVSFDGSPTDFYRYYTATFNGLRAVIPSPVFSPGEFTGVGTCGPGQPNCVHATKEFLDFARRSHVTVSYGPRSLHSLLNGRQCWPSEAVRRAVTSYEEFRASSRKSINSGCCSSHSARRGA